MRASVSGSNLLCGEWMYPNSFMAGFNIPFVPTNSGNTGSIKKVNGVDFANIGKVNGVAVGSIKKVNGVVAQ